MSAASVNSLLGDNDDPFTGTFDGNERNGFGIDGYTCSPCSKAGLFEELSGDGVLDFSGDGLIFNLQVSNINITTGGNTNTVSRRGKRTRQWTQ